MKTMKTTTAGSIKMGQTFIVCNSNEYKEWTVTNAHGGTPSIRRIFATDQNGKKGVFNFGMMLELHLKD